MTPLVQPQVDLRDFDYMPLHVSRLRDSGFTAKAKPEEFRAGVLLWCASWHQLPAGSLPNDDGQLAKLAGYGYIVRAWMKIKPGALYGWALCDDDRLYHPTVAEVVAAAWESKLKHLYSKLVDRIRKENRRLAENKLPQVHIPTFETWKSNGIPPEIGKSSDGIPPEKTLKGREGKGSIPSGVDLRDSTKEPVDNSGQNPSAILAEKQVKTDPTPREWWKSNDGISAKAKAVGITARPGEDWPDLKDRVFALINKPQAAA